ncbi:MAG: CatB-related O-acetyltransferase [Sphaerochaetaceae bacterium]|nr:CatB-related O-acetyltransferase [Sphaerochaetaceae bacterium]
MILTYFWAKILKKVRCSAIINSKIHKTSKIESGSHIVNSKFEKHSFCGYNCEIINSEIGSFCSIANNVIIGAYQHPINWVSTSPVFRKGKDSVKTKFSEHSYTDCKITKIGHDVWIGNNVLIKNGVSIGTGSIIGMGSVVTKDVLPYTIVGGVPAREIRKRFEIEIIEELVASEWWNYDNHLLKKYANYFTDPVKFIKEIKKI